MSSYAAVQARSPTSPATVKSAAPPSAAYRGSGGLLASTRPAVSLMGRLPVVGGEPLAAAVRMPIESTTGEGLGHVRVHRDAQSAAAVDGIGARAFTYGSGVYLGSRESPTDLRLMAHEATHTLQQRHRPALQAKGGMGGDAVLESEADRVASAVSRGQRMAVSGAVAPRPQFSWLGDVAGAVVGGVKSAAGAVASGVKAAASAVADSIGAVVQKAVNYLRERAQSIPGYDLLAFALGRDPLTQAPVARNATTLLKALLGMVPGGAQIFENLEKAKVLEKAFQWAGAELEKLGLTWARVRGAVEKFIATLQLSDAFNLGGVFERAKAIFGGIVDAAIRFAKAAGGKLMEFIFEGAMALAGPAGQRILGVFRKVGDTFKLIVNDPIGFLRNLVEAVKGGFEMFRDNFGEHLKNAIFGWLFGALADAGIKLPAKFDLKGIVSLILQVLGLTYDNLRGRLVKLVGEPVVSAVETGLEFVVTLIRDGVAAAWDKIVEFAGNLKDMLIGTIKDFLIKTVVGKAIIQIASMLNPAGALIQACIKIYETVMFVIEKAKQIMEFVEAVTDSLANIARGNIGAAKAYVEKTLARILPLVISFLARLVGLGGLSDHIRKAIEKIQAPINNALDKLTEWIKEKAKSLVGKAKDVLMWWKKKKPFKGVDGSKHDLMFSGEGPGAKIGFHSDEFSRLDEFLDKKKTKATEAETTAIALIRADVGKLQAVLAKYADQTKGAARDAKKDSEVEESLSRIAENVAKLVGGSATGTSDKPYPLFYPKRSANLYRTLVFGPLSSKPLLQVNLKNGDSEAGRAAILKDLSDSEAKEWKQRSYKLKSYSPLKRESLGGATIGVSANYQTRQGVKFELNPHETTGGYKILNALKPYGFSADNERMDGDHLLEMQLGGPNELENLWPLDAGENRSSGSTLSRMKIKLPDGKSEIKMTDLKDQAKQGKKVWMFIAGTLSTTH